MLYRSISTAFALGLAANCNAFQIAATPRLSAAARMDAVSPNVGRHPQWKMSAAGGTETVDFTAGEIRPQRDVTDEQMRPRPSIDWTNLRAKLEIEFGLTDEELKKYDDISNDDLLKA